MQKFALLQSRGFGLGARPDFYSDILGKTPKSVDWFEFITENFLSIGGKPRRILNEIRNDYPIAFHGVGLSIGSPDPLSSRYLKLLKKLVDETEPFLVSDHLCFTSMGGHNTHDLLPLPYTNKNLQLLSERLDQIQNLLGRRFLLENPSAYVAFELNDFSEAEFLSELSKRTGCGFLLDVNNLYVNQMNLGLCPITYLNTLPPNTVEQIHLAGHMIQTSELGTVRVDTHDHPICDEVWDLLSKALTKWPKASTMIEWDDQIPAFDELVTMLEKARTIQRKGDARLSPPPEKGDARLSPEAPKAEASLFSLAVDEKGIDEGDQRLSVLASDLPTPSLVGARVYNNAYYARLRDVLKSDFTTLASVMNDEAFDSMVAHYLVTYPPSEFSVNLLGKKLSKFLRHHTIDDVDFGVTQNILADIAELDCTRASMFVHHSEDRPLPIQTMQEISPDQWSLVEFTLAPASELIQLTSDTASVWKAVDESLDLIPPREGTFSILVWRHQESVYHRTLPQDELLVWTELKSTCHFLSAVQSYAEKQSKTLDEAAPIAVKLLTQWFIDGLVHGINI